MKFVCTALLTLLLTGPASAGSIDLSTQTCRQFLAQDGEEIKAILIWLDAYYRDDDAPPVIEMEKFVANAKKLGDYCRENPSIGLITATDKLFGSD
jgi:acid stress chaperone HdeB